MTDNSIGNDKTRLPDKNSGGHAYALRTGDTLGQYRIIKSLGAGGMGEVYEVEHQVLGRRYALKLLPTTLDWQGVSLERFRREAKVMANLEHPNILRVDEFGETDGRYWLRMELMEGAECSGKRVVSLQDLAEAYGGKLPQEILLPILRQILEGLDYAHKHGAIHRDLKPSNILLSSPNTETRTPNIPFVMIADFGLVKLVGEEWVRSQAQISVQRSMSESQSISDAKTQAGASPSEGTSTRALLGTFEYMSPEQKRGEEVDARSDLYAVGLMAFRLLTGRNPGTKPPSRIDPLLVPGWDDFVEQALEEVSLERLASATEGMRLLPEAIAQAQAADIPLQKSVPQSSQTITNAVASTTQPKPSVPSGDPTAGNELGMAFVEVAAGSFEMGYNSGAKDEKPVRTVRITRDFWMGKYGVTQKQYHQLMGSNPSYFKGDDLPVEQVSWNDAVKFCDELTKRARSAGRLPSGMVYRLPTEAEWEYAARGGNESQGYNTYSGGNDLKTVGWFSDNSGRKTHPVGGKTANELGIYDMSGNVWEWCYDWYQNSYSGLLTTDPKGPADGSNRVFRGGSWGYFASVCRVANREFCSPSYTYSDLGFRVVLGPSL